MSQSNRASKLVLLFLGVLLVVFFTLSLNRYKSSFLSWQSQLSDLRLVVRELNGAIHMVRGGAWVDYDMIVEKEQQLQSLTRGLIEHEVRAGSQSLELKGEWLINQREISLPVKPLVDTVSELSHVIETFKTDFSTLRNSQFIVFRLIDDLMSEFANSPELRGSLRELESSVLHLTFLNQRSSLAVAREHLGVLRESFREKEPHLQSLDYIESHIEVIVTQRETVEVIINSEVQLQESLNRQVGRLESALQERYQNELDRAGLFSYLFFASAVLALLFGSMLIRKTSRLGAQLAVHNRNLEELVSQRTANLKAATDRLETEKADREGLLEQLAEAKEKSEAILNTIHGCVAECDLKSREIQYISNGAMAIWGLTPDEIKSIDQLAERIHPDDVPEHLSRFATLSPEKPVINIEYRVNRGPDDVIWVREVTTASFVNGKPRTLVAVAVDISEFKTASQERQRIEEELVHAQKLESVGQLAAGIAHEINTPAQFISDNLVFLQDAVGDVLKLVADAREKINAKGLADLSSEIDELCEDVDLEYLEGEILPALKQSFDGISSIAKIIRAMKDYSHPGETFELADLNKAIESTVTISRTEWKYFAQLEMALDESLPMVECVVSDINQVVLNMIVNAAHAIVEKYDDPDNLEGRITISTGMQGDTAVIEIRDNGNGMPEAVKARIFEHFFTTKEVGKGTGQGLSLAYRMVVEKHRGKIEVDSEMGEGTTFRILLPVNQPDKSEETDVREASYSAEFA